MPKAIVLPVPVWARPRTSLPAIASGIALSWIGVGLVRPASLRAARRTGLRPRVSKSDKRYPLRPHAIARADEVRPHHRGKRGCRRTLRHHGIAPRRLAL